MLIIGLGMLPIEAACIDLSEAVGVRTCEDNGIPVTDGYVSFGEFQTYFRVAGDNVSEKPEIVSTHSAQNNQCIGKRCPFARANHPTAK